MAGRPPIYDSPSESPERPSYSTVAQHTPSQGSAKCEMQRPVVHWDERGVGDSDESADPINLAAPPPIDWDWHPDGPTGEVLSNVSGVFNAFFARIEHKVQLE